MKRTRNVIDRERNTAVHTQLILVGSDNNSIRRVKAKVDLVYLELSSNKKEPPSSSLLGSSFIRIVMLEMTCRENVGIKNHCHGNNILQSLKKIDQLTSGDTLRVL